MRMMSHQIEAIDEYTEIIKKKSESNSRVTNIIK